MTRLTAPLTSSRRFFAAVLFVLLLATGAWACGEDCVDADEAYRFALREGRDPVEGFWGIYIDWHPEPGTTRHYRMAVVKNLYDVYPEAGYVGVATCDQGDCKKGEIKLLLEKIPGETDAFMATLLTKDGGAKGLAVLTKDPDDDREKSALDMREVRYDGKRMTNGMLRIIGG